jgi:guanine nucleotide-binding protein subunit alpha
MKIIHQNGYSRDELGLYRLTIYKNLVDCAKALIGGMQQFEIVPESDDIINYCTFLMDYQVDPDPQTPLDREVGEAVVALCKDPSYNQVMEHQSEFYLMDSAP